jgi:hypothetical protein
MKMMIINSQPERSRQSEAAAEAGHPSSLHYDVIASGKPTRRSRQSEATAEANSQQPTANSQQPTA